MIYILGLRTSWQILNATKNKYYWTPLLSTTSTMMDRTQKQLVTISYATPHRKAEQKVTILVKFGLFRTQIFLLQVEFSLLFISYRAQFTNSLDFHLQIRFFIHQVLQILIWVISFIILCLCYSFSSLSFSLQLSQMVYSRSLSITIATDITTWI